MNKTEQNFLKIINETLSNNSFLGDDCAYLKDFGVCITQDSLCEGVHFDLNLVNPCQLGRKACLVNISDILASGARPKYATVALCGDLKAEFLRQFYIGVNEICEKYGVTVVGGDLCGAKTLTISICLIGDTKGRSISSRKNAQDGYVVAVCGTFGASAKGLEDLKKGKKTREAKAHLEPILDEKTSKTIATSVKHPYAMMDSSDGLFDALSQIAAQSGVRVEIEYSKIPKSVENRDFVLFGGEDYCLITVLEEKDFKTAITQGANLVQIGKITSGQGVWVDNEEIKEDKSYKHW